MGPDQALPVTVQAAETVAARIATSTSLHAAPGLEARHHVGPRGILASTSGNELMAVGVTSRQVEKIDASEGDEEAAEQRECVDRVGRVEAAKEDEGCAQGSRGEGDVVQRVDATVPSVSVHRAAGGARA